MDQNQFEQTLADSLEAISESAPAAPQADTIHHLLRRRKRRRISRVITALVLLACGFSVFLMLSENRQDSTEAVAVQPLVTIDVSVHTQSWTLPTMKFAAVSSPSLEIQDHMTADMPASSIPSGVADVSPNIPLRFITPRVSLPKL